MVIINMLRVMRRGGAGACDRSIFLPFRLVRKVTSWPVNCVQSFAGRSDRGLRSGTQVSYS